MSSVPDIELGYETLVDMLDLREQSIGDLEAIEIYNPSDYVEIPNVDLGMHTPEAGLEILKRCKLDCSYGERDSTPGIPLVGIYAWTKTRVIFTHEYDTSYTLRSVPRNPEDS